MQGESSTCKNEVAFLSENVLIASKIWLWSIICIFKSSESLESKQQVNSCENKEFHCRRRFYRYQHRFCRKTIKSFVIDTMQASSADYTDKLKACRAICFFQQKVNQNNTKRAASFLACDHLHLTSKFPRNQLYKTYIWNESTGLKLSENYYLIQVRHLGA